jgi:hypothetical protein
MLQQSVSPWGRKRTNRKQWAHLLQVLTVCFLVGKQARKKEHKERKATIMAHSKRLWETSSTCKKCEGIEN